MTDDTRPQSKLAAALDLARHGFPIFPIVPDGKIPLIANWQNLATSNLEQVAATWAAVPDANIGIHTANYLVVDIDPRHGGDASLVELELTEDWPETVESITQSGGTHRIYAMPPNTAVSNSKGKLGKGIDIRSYGGLIVAPGSTIETRQYRWAPGKSPAERTIAEAPAWLIARCKAPRPKSADAGKRIVDETEDAVDAAWDWLVSKAPYAEAGERDDTAYKVAAKLYDFALEPATAREFLQEWNEAKCNPPLDPGEIEHVVSSAQRYRTSAIGSASPNAPGFEAYELPDRAETRESNGSNNRNLPIGKLATPFAFPAPTSIPPRPWVVDTFACRQRVSMMTGPGGVAKSTLLLAVAIATAAGRDDICGFKIKQRTRVWVWNQEDDIDEMNRRTLALMQAFNVSKSDIENRLFINSGVDRPLVLAKRTLEQSIVGGKDTQTIIQEIRALDIGLAIFDPLIEFHEANENDNVQMRAVLGQVRDIAVLGNCATVLAAHTRKPPQASSDGFAGEMDATRGASAQAGVVRIAETLFSASPKDAKEWAFSGHHGDYVRLDSAKNNLAPRRKDPLWFRRDQVSLGESFDGTGGEMVGILRPVDIKRREAEMKHDILDIIAGTIARGMGAGTWHRIGDIVSRMDDDETAAFPDMKNRTRFLDEAFGGADEYATNYGVLKRIAKVGRHGNMFLLEIPQIPQNRDEELLV